MKYSIELRDWIFVKCCGFLYFAKKFSVKCCQKSVDQARQSATDALKTSKKAIEKAAETGNLIGSKIADEITDT